MEYSTSNDELLSTQNPSAESSKLLYKTVMNYDGNVPEVTLNKTVRAVINIMKRQSGSARPSDSWTDKKEAL